MLSFDAAKTYIHSNKLNQKETLTLLVATEAGPVSLARVRELAIASGVRAAAKWNCAAIFARAPHYAIRVGAGWELAPFGVEWVSSLRVAEPPQRLAKVASGLRDHISTVRDEGTRLFLEEAIQCFESKAYRAAIVLSWVGAVWLLQREVFERHLQEFNAECLRRDPKFRAIKTMDDFGRLGERDFLQVCAAVSLIGKSLKQQLEDRLDLRNACGHPNTLAVGENTVAAHIEILLENVFERFQPS